MSVSSVGPDCLAAPATELSLISSPEAGVPNGAPTSVRLVVSGDGRGDGGGATGSGGVGAAACSAIRASMDADMGGSSLTVFRTL
ncbi:hypothetical protein Tco_1087031 [Tanacetum coccineum]